MYCFDCGLTYEECACHLCDGQDPDLADLHEIEEEAEAA